MPESTDPARGGLLGKLKDWWRRGQVRNQAAVYGDMSDGERHYSYDLSRDLQMSPASVMAALAKLEREGVVESGWDEVARPRRRWYRLVSGR